MKGVKQYSAYSALAAVSLCFVWALSRDGRGIVDWVVLALLAAALIYNLFMLGRRL